jgi:PAS domain S-box-containing protein
MSTDPKDVHALRSKAEKLLSDVPARLAAMSGANLQELIHELSVHQVELEMQNDELRRSQEQLEESRSEYADLYDFAPVGYLTFDKMGLVTRANLTACVFLGIERSILVTKPFTLFIHHESQDLFYLHKQKVLESTTTQTCQLVLKRKDGTFFDAQLEKRVEERTTDLRAEIAERRRAEEALRESEERYRTAIESSNDGVAITRDGLHVYVNQRFLEMFGYGDAEEILGKPVGDVIHPDDRQRIVEMNMKRQTGEILRSKTEFVGIRSDGSPIHLEGSSSRITYGGEPASLSCLRDITHHKRAQEQLRESHERLRALAARLQAIREEERARVAREIHDELGQTLTCMKIDLWQIREESSLDPVDKDEVLLKIESLLGFIDATVDTVRRIASDLRPSVLDDLGLVPAIEWQLSDFQRRTGIICAFRKPRRLVIDKDYSSVLFRVFQESLTNVVRHSEAEKVEITLGKTKGELVLTIRDNGKGMPESEVSNGASLGILGMRERVLPFDGDIQITGKPGKGTRVTVRMPLPGSKTKNRNGHRRSCMIRVLIADDHPVRAAAGPGRRRPRRP